MSSNDETHALLDQLIEARKKSGQIRFVGVAVVTAIFAFFATMVYNRIQNFDSSTLLDSLQESSAHIVWPMVSEELDNMSQAAIPVISDAIVSELQNLGPKLSEAALQESQTFQNNMGEYIKTSLDRELGLAFKAQKDRINGSLEKVVEDPMLKDELAMALQTKTQQWAQNHLDTTFEEHLLLLQSINETLQALQQETRTKDGTAGSANVEDLVLVITELLNERIGDKEEGQ